GREGAREGLYEYLICNGGHDVNPAKEEPVFSPRGAPERERSFAALGRIDRTAKNYVGGKQARPDSGYSYDVPGKGGAIIGQAPLGNRKDIRNAVEAAARAEGWGGVTAHNRAQVLYYIG